MYLRAKVNCGEKAVTGSLARRARFCPGHLPGERKRQLRALMAFGRSRSRDFAAFARDLDDEAMAREQPDIVAVATDELASNLYHGLKRADDLGLALE